MRRHPITVLAVLFVSLVAQIAAGAAGDYDAKATDAWRAKQEADLRDPGGWLSVVGLTFLKPGVNTVGTKADDDVVLPVGAGLARIGRLTYDAGRVWLDLEPGVSATSEAGPISTRVELRAPGSDAKQGVGRVTVGHITFLLHASGSRLAVRVRDPQSELLRGFTGRRWFPINGRWAVSGKFVPYAQPVTIPAQNILGDNTPTVSPGEVEFKLDGATYRLIAYGSRERLSFVLRDATAGSETYRIRFLSASASADGSVLVDFNRAYNPPCAFNPNTTCPVPPPQNRLAIAIPAGERIYQNHDQPTTHR